MLLQRTVPIGASTGERICGNGLEEEPTGYAAPKTHLIFGFRIVMVPLISNRLRGLTRPIDGARTVAIWWGVECETECHHRRVRQIYFTPRSRTTKWKLATNARIQQRLVNQSDSGGRRSTRADLSLPASADDDSFRDLLYSIPSVQIKDVIARYWIEDPTGTHS